MHVNVIGSLAVFRRLFEYIDLPPGGRRRSGRPRVGLPERSNYRPSAFTPNARWSDDQVRDGSMLSRVWGKG
jgi:hypothetical protein